MKCNKCLYPLNSGDWQLDGELVCPNCGSAFGLEYLGYYPLDSDERVDEGFETNEHRLLVKKLRSNNKK